METIEYRYADRAGWKSGEWDNEPDKIQWPDEATGLPCLIVRGPSGALCGYVGVAEGHPFYKKDYSDCTLDTAKPKGKTEGDDKYGEWTTNRSRNRLVCGEAWCDHQPQSMLEVHGGITFSDSCHESPDGRGICHKPSPGEPEHVWWFGFDCAHAWDVCPGRDYSFDSYDSSYRNVDYVRGQCRDLAKQLDEIGKQKP